MTEIEEPKVNVDKQHRVCDKQGRPLRDRQARNFKKGTPDKGQPAGKPHPRQKRLDARIAAFENDRVKVGRKKPGSVKG